MSSRPHPTSRAARRGAPPPLGDDRVSQTFRFPPHSQAQAQGYSHLHHQPGADDARPDPDMDSVLYYQQQYQPQDSRRPDELTPSSSSSHVSPVVLDRSPGDSMNANRKRINSASAPGPARKKVRKDDEADESASPADLAETKELKAKSTRGARYVCFGVIYSAKSCLSSVDATRLQGLHGLPPPEDAL